MKATNEELTEAIVTLSSVLAGMLEFNANLAKTIVPLSENLSEVQKRSLLADIEKMPLMAQGLRESCKQLKLGSENQHVGREEIEHPSQVVAPQVTLGTEHKDLMNRAEAGDAEAQFHLGKLFVSATETAGEENYDCCQRMAVKWYLSAAEKDCLEAQLEIAHRYQHGWDVAKDEDKAIDWYRKAAGHGSTQAEYELASLQEKRNPTESFELYQRLAKQGNATAQLRLASMYEDGVAVPKNESEAFHWLLEAAKSGDANACDVADAYETVGRKLLLGEGTRKNISEAILWLLKAANPKTTGASQMAMSSAQLCLGMAYADTEFSKRDLVEAYKWTNLAITNNRFDDFHQQMITKRDAIAQEMTRDQIEEAQRRSSESFIPYGKIVDRICGESE